MTRYLLAALLLILALFGAGYRLREWLWEKEAAKPPSASAAQVKAPQEPSPAIELVSVTGDVEVRQSPDGAWRPLALGVKLDADDTLRTDKGARAELSIGADVHVELAERSQFALAQVTRDLSRMRLDSGRVATRLDPDATSKVRLEVLGNTAVAEASQGAFTVLRAEDGQVTVAATEGKVSLVANQRRVELGAGNQSVVPVNGEPSAPVRIPASLFLKVAHSARTQLNRRETAVMGTTAPGAIVSINGVAAQTDSNGAFATRIPLQEGTNTLTVTASDALGRIQMKQVAVEVDTKAPKLGSKVVW